MSDTYIDLVNRLLKYNGYDISIIFDGKNNIWFSASDCVTLMGYQKKNAASIIRKFVNNKHIQQFKHLKKYLGNIPHNAQDSALYVNQQGLYSFLLSSNKPRASDFFDWIIESVLPSIFAVGKYKEDRDHITKIKNMNVTIRKLRKTVDKLKYNMKKNKYPHGGYVYVYKEDGKYKTGKTDKMNKRFGTYNTSFPDDIKPLHYIEVNDPIAVENCIKAALRKYIYRNNKEFYDVSITKIKYMMNKCAELVKSDFRCNVCNKKSHNLHALLKHSSSSHVDSELSELFVQTGGSIDDIDLDDDDDIDDMNEDNNMLRQVINKCIDVIDNTFDNYKHNIYRCSNDMLCKYISLLETEKYEKTNNIIKPMNSSVVEKTNNDDVMKFLNSFVTTQS
jgi:prophage antirepressor-like protein